MADETKGWKVYRKEWYNDRVMETYINAPIIDKQNDLIPTDVLEESMDFYMKYGVYSYQHEEIPIGLPLAYKIDSGKIKVKYGIHNQLEMHNNVWEEIKDFGTKGASSIRGETLSQDLVCPDGADTCFNKINDLGLWSVSWVGDNPANVQATVTDVAMAKADKTPNFINETNKVALMAKKDADCECSTEKAEETEVIEEAEVKSEEVSVEVISPEELPDVVEEEVKEDEPKELTLEYLAEEMKSLRTKLEELTVPTEKEEEEEEEKEEEEEEEKEEEEEAEKSNADVDPSLELVMKSLKKYGISVYAGAKKTPASATNSTKVESFDWNNVSKSWDELEDTIGDN